MDNATTNYRKLLADLATAQAEIASLISERDVLRALLSRCMWECNWSPKHNGLVLAMKPHVDAADAAREG